jgi:hypothetical protein
MKRKISIDERFKQKTYKAWLIRIFLQYYNLSLAESEALFQFISMEFKKLFSQSLQQGQIWYRALSIHEPAGKKLALCDKKMITLTLITDDDIELRATKGIYQLHKVQVLRLTAEAFQQKTLLTQEDLAILLNVSVSTIKRIIAEYRQQGICVLTRGSYNDIGPGTSHKSQIVRRYLLGYTETEISNHMHHSLNSIERYLIDFTRVFLLHKQNYSVNQIRLTTRLSARLIEEYMQLYKYFSQLDEYQYKLCELENHYRLMLKKNNTFKGGR